LNASSATERQQTRQWHHQNQGFLPDFEPMHRNGYLKTYGV
jgi:hypothetical protein